ncbi:ABC transporter permease [Candidatus Woesearchaeota archaeon]|nr:ABC transporter permease [Candidatus Woesearchaeota archaeon]
MNARLQLIIATLGARKLRTALTLLGIFVGIATIVALISVGQGLKDAISLQFAALGTDRIIVQPKSAVFGPPGQGAAAQLTKDDAEQVKHAPGVAAVARRLIKSAKAEFNHRVQFTFLGSMPEDADGRRLIEESFRLKTAQGRLLKQGDRNVVVLGNRFLDKERFGKAVSINDKILINDRSFEVVGILDKLGQPQFDSIVLMPEEAMRDLYGLPDEVSALAVRAAKGTDINTVADAITRELRRFRHVKEGKEDFTVQTQGQLLGAVNNIIDVVQIVLVGIAAIALVVGGIGIMNTMYTSVLQRTKDIGIMKAVGATNKDIFMLFLLESGILGLAGGIIGVLLGMGLASLVEFGAAQSLGSGLIKASFPGYLIIGALVFSFLIGAISGTLPAYQASRLKPVDSLRYE